MGEPDRVSCRVRSLWVSVYRRFPCGCATARDVSLQNLTDTLFGSNFKATSHTAVAPCDTQRQGPLFSVPTAFPTVTRASATCHPGINAPEFFNKPRMVRAARRAMQALHSLSVPLNDDLSFFYYQVTNPTKNKFIWGGASRRFS